MAEKGPKDVKKDGKQAKTKDKDKKGFKQFAAGFSRSFKDLQGEIKKIVWPTKKQVLNNTGVVIVVMVVSSLFLGGLDFVLKSLVNLLFRNA